MNAFLLMHAINVFFFAFYSLAAAAAAAAAAWPIQNGWLRLVSFHFPWEATNGKNKHRLSLYMSVSVCPTFWVSAARLRRAIIILISVRIWKFVFKKCHPRPLFHLFLVFSNKQYIFNNKTIWKLVMSIQYMVPGFEPTTSQTWDISHNH